jgi:hypothetical protein
MRSVLVTGAAFTLLLLCVTLSGCVRRDAGKDGKKAAAATIPGWVRHTDPAGFAVEHPPKWEVEVGADARILVRSPDRSAFALAQPFLLTDSPVPPDAAAFVRKHIGQFNGLFPLPRLGRVTTAKAGEAVAELSYRRYGLEGSANLLCLLDGRSGMLFAVAAPRPTFPADRATLSRILQTLTFTDPAAGGIHDPFYRWRDPKERMFELDVPDGWTVEGGLFRYGPADARTEVRAVSPDGRIRVSVGDATLPPYALPTPTLEEAGFREGMEYDPGFGTKYIVRRYETGAQYARDYAVRRLSPGMRGLTNWESRDRSDAAEAIQDIYEEGGTVFEQVSIGDVTFRGTTAAGPVSGYCLAATMRSGVAGVTGGVWTVNLLYSYTAPPEREAEARTVLRRMAASFRLNPDWVTAQQGLAAPLTEIVSQSSQVVSRTLDAAFRGAALAEGGDTFASDMTLGMADWRDPVSGQLYEAVVGKNYYWQRAGTPPRPAVDLSALGTM